MNTEEKISAYQQAFLDATMNSLLYGHGFVRVTHNANSFEVSAVSIEEYPEISQLMNFVSINNINSGEKL